MAFQSDGKIVIKGQADGSTSPDFMVARCLNNGDLDVTFDGDGLMTAGLFGSFDIIGVHCKQNRLLPMTHAGRGAVRKANLSPLPPRSKTLRVKPVSRQTGK